MTLWRIWRSSRQREADAEERAKLAGERLEEARREVIEPLRQRQHANQFAEIIRRSVIAGHGGREG